MVRRQWIVEVSSTVIALMDKRNESKYLNGHNIIMVGRKHSGC